MKKHIGCMLLVFMCGCAVQPGPGPVPHMQVQTQAALASSPAKPFEFAYKSDIPASHVMKKNAELWEYVQPGYYVPLATMRDNDVASSLLRDAAADKTQGTVQQLILGGTAYYRALLGPFKTKKIAEKQAQEFSKKHLVDETPTTEFIAG